MSNRGKLLAGILAALTIISSVIVILQFSGYSRIQCLWSPCDVTPTIPPTVTAAVATPTSTPKPDVTNPYRPGTTLVFHDFRVGQTTLTERWDINADCIYSTGVYRIIEANAGVFFPCDAH